MKFRYINYFNIDMDKTRYILLIPAKTSNQDMSFFQGHILVSRGGKGAWMFWNLTEVFVMSAYSSWGGYVSQKSTGSTWGNTATYATDGLYRVTYKDTPYLAVKYTATAESMSQGGYQVSGAWQNASFLSVVESELSDITKI